MQIKVCVECGHDHWTNPELCPACEGLINYKRKRYEGWHLFTDIPFSEKAFQATLKSTYIY